MFEITWKQGMRATSVSGYAVACVVMLIGGACEERTYSMNLTDASVGSVRGDAGLETLDTSQQTDTSSEQGLSETSRSSAPHESHVAPAYTAATDGADSDAGSIGTSYVRFTAPTDDGSQSSSRDTVSSSGAVSVVSANGADAGAPTFTSASSTSASFRSEPSLDAGADAGTTSESESTVATSSESASSVDVVVPITCDGVPVDGIRPCTTPELGCAGTQTCTVAGWSTCVSVDAGCVCSNGATDSCTGNHGCDGTQACSGNRWGGCTCNDPTWVCTPQDPEPCVSGEGCGGSTYCDNYGHWSGGCVAPNRCPSGFSSTPYDCAWTSAYQGAHIDWDEYVCTSKTNCSDLALDSVPSGGGQSQAMYLEVRLAQAGPCNTGNLQSAWVGCAHPETGEEYGRYVADVEFNNQVTLQLRCAAGSHLIAYKAGPAGANGCWRAYDIVIANNHDPVAIQCAY